MDKVKYKGDLHFVAYCDFETTAPTYSYFDPENKEMFAVSYVIVFAFHPDLIELLLKEILVTTGYLNRNQLSFAYSMTMLQLRDCEIKFSKKKSKVETSEVFITELRFAADWLMKCFDKKFKSKNLELSPHQKTDYERKSPVD